MTNGQEGVGQSGVGRPAMTSPGGTAAQEAVTLAAVHVATAAVEMAAKAAVSAQAAVDAAVAARHVATQVVEVAATAVVQQTDDPRREEGLSTSWRSASDDTDGHDVAAVEGQLDRDAMAAAAAVDGEAARRDGAAETRDQAAEARDQAASARDLKYFDGDETQSFAHRLLAAEPGSAALTEEDSTMRAMAAVVREQAASLRELAREAAASAPAAADRERAADDRAASALDRAEAAQDRADAQAYLQHAYLDRLTGALQRDAGRDQLRRIVEQARRSKAPLVIAFLDVDRLKQVNDTLGHAAGDRLLRAVGAVLTRELRAYDIVVRDGGDEFVCALPETLLSDANTRFEQVRVELDRTLKGATISIGLAQLEPGETTEQVLARADRQMYDCRAQQRRNWDAG